MKKLNSLFLILIFSMTAIFGGCGKNANTSTAESAEKKSITVKDSKGNSVTLPSSPKKVVVLNNAAAEIIHVLGEDDKIVGVNDKLKFPDTLAKKARVGAGYTPSVEKILELKPDLVIGYSDNIKKETIDKIKASDIQYIAVDAFKIASLNDDIKTLGTIFDKKEKADEYINFINKYVNMVKERVEKVKSEQKALVYWEGGADYKTVAKGAGGDEVMTMCGVTNIAGKESVAYPQISNEWVLEKNPNIIVKIGKYSVPFGYGITDTKAMIAEKDKLTKRTGWENVNAVKDGKVYIISNEIATSARSVVGICYLAKWSYPDLFKDLDPDAVHKELLEKFYKLEYKGTWVCQ